MASPLNTSPPLAITMGEPGGIGGELTIKAWRALSSGDAAFFVIDDATRLEAMGAPVERISSPAEAAKHFARRLPVLDLGPKFAVKTGVADKASAPHVIASIERAVALALAGEAAGVVTNPIQKASLIAAGFNFPGHTEFLGALTEQTPMPGGRHRGPIMMLAGPELRTVPVTVHEPLARAAAGLTSDAIVHAGLVTAEALQHDFDVARPRLAIAGLNPHAGEGGALGKEDGAIIAPAVEALCKAGVDAGGGLRPPTPCSTKKRARPMTRRSACITICGAHPDQDDQLHDAVNVTLGLPIARTSPDHAGTALDIAGKNIARADSLIAAIKLAAEMAGLSAPLQNE
ncbi:MAG: 4-hydroxythreonine-4-phosphate dehydrogenase PdxA [Parvularculaceae bacterium]